jgi:hypothetical protein
MYTFLQTDRANRQYYKPPVCLLLYPVNHSKLFKNSTFHIPRPLFSGLFPTNILTEVLKMSDTETKCFSIQLNPEMSTKSQQVYEIRIRETSSESLQGCW